MVVAEEGGGAQAHGRFIIDLLYLLETLKFGYVFEIWGGQNFTGYVFGIWWWQRRGGGARVHGRMGILL